MDAFLLVYLALGLVAGFVAGLLGVGGGLLMVPVLTWAYAAQGFAPAFNIHLALGTSMAVIVLTSVSSLRAHHAHGAVDWPTVRRMAPGILAGTLGYVISGHAVDGLPVGNLGFVYLPALAAIAAGSWLTAPLGARATHRWPTAIIKKIFAGLLYLLGVRMAYGLLPG